MCVCVCVCVLESECGRDGVVVKDVETLCRDLLVDVDGRGDTSNFGWLSNTEASRIKLCACEKLGKNVPPN